MNDKNRKVELMAPLKNYKSLNAVLKNTDAVYFGIESLNMRMFSDNFKLIDLNKIVNICHENSIKGYLTTNVIIYENEIELIDKILTKALEAEKEVSEKRALAATEALSEEAEAEITEEEIIVTEEAGAEAEAAEEATAVAEEAAPVAEEAVAEEKAEEAAPAVEEAVAEEAAPAKAEDTAKEEADTEEKPAASEKKE